MKIPLNPARRLASYATRPARTVLSLVLLASLLLPGVARAQTADQVGRAIVQACGTRLDPQTQGVLAGTVTDSITGVPLPNARVSIVWQSAEADSANKAEVSADKNGFFSFCGVPGNTLLLLSANLRTTSPPRSVTVEPGTLQVERILLKVSDPTKPGALVGRVIDKGTREPISGAEVSIEELKAKTLTNERGYFSFGDRPYGTYTIKVTHLAYADADVPIHVAGNLTQNVEIEMVSQPIQLPGIQVTVTPRRLHRDLEGLIQRMNLGFGQFVTRETLEKRPQATLADLMRTVPGILVFKDGIRAYLEVRGKPCTPDIYLDGQLFPTDPSVGINEFESADLEAVEVYKGQETPGEFLRPGGVYPCAVVVVWTHRGR
ncbi:MAG: carboxypeptidase regulatory-like domain-containing protein [Gemmatimonadota bacterium]|jgi:hypothetical protein